MLDVGQVLVPSIANINTLNYQDEIPLSSAADQYKFDIYKLLIN